MEIGYKIRYNANDTVMESSSNDTEFELVGLPAGVYLFTVLAFNILGDGKEETAQGSYISTFGRWKPIYQKCIYIYSFVLLH